MRKLKLAVSELRVETFVPVQTQGAMGTVRGHESEGSTTCDSNDPWCQSSDCPDTGMRDCDNFSEIELSKCCPDTQGNCTAGGCPSYVC
jgi:hypothetical protein